MKRWLPLSAVLFCGLFGPVEVAHSEPVSEEFNLERHLKRSLKESIREGLLHHNLREHLRPYDKKGVFVIGRESTTDAHDITLTYRQRESYLRRRWRATPSGQEAVFIRQFKLTHDGDHAFVDLETTLHFFGGVRTERTRHKVRVDGRSSRVIHTRIWPTHETLSGLTTVYNEAHWDSVDEAAFKLILSPNTSWQMLFQTMLTAHWYPLLFEYLKDTSAARPKDPEVWKALAAIAYLCGDMQLVKRAIKKARRLNPEITLPMALK